jgi:5-methylthioadenosine/S-adenosylhomocysteine deaminase
MKDAAIRIALGSDWSPSGSKNLLCELKAARLFSSNAPGGPIFTDEELARAATTTAAQMLDWTASLGSLEATKLADLIVIKGTTGNPYTKLIDATERDIKLVAISGVPAAGTPRLMSALGIEGERWRVDGHERTLNFDLPGADERVRPVTLAAARATLTSALADLPALAAALEISPDAAILAAAPHIEGAATPNLGTLALDEVNDTGCDLRRQTGDDITPVFELEATLPPLSTVLQPLRLDALTIVDDNSYLPAPRSTNEPTGLSRAWHHRRLRLATATQRRS